MSYEMYTSYAGAADFSSSDEWEVDYWKNDVITYCF
jgi:hypothetical protein